MTDPASGPTWRLPAAHELAGDDGALDCRAICEVQLAQALGKSKLADVRFLIKGQWVASGHRSVLSARSEVFSGMF